MMHATESSEFADADLREDALLGGRVRLLQPLKGYRAATDPVFLAAACVAEPGARVLDLGCGGGAAALCLSARIPGLELHGLEAQAPYATLSVRNAALNDVAWMLHLGDLRHPPASLRALNFDHVICNPPFHVADGATPAEDSGRDMANRENEAGVADWIDAALRRLASRGGLTMIHLAQRTPEILEALNARAGDIRLLPLASREGRAAKRVIVSARKGARGPFRLLPPFVIHHGPAHFADADDFTEAARAILTDAAPLPLSRN
jgi:tRNA1(Val) A37 N6-methylase TrmN6